MSDLSLSDQLLYTALKITACAGITPIGTGTGFFYKVQGDNGLEAPLLITNKHVIEGATSVMMTCHVAGPGAKPSGELIRLVMDLDLQSLLPHPDPEVDLVAIPYAALQDEAVKIGKPLFYVALTRAEIPSDKEWETFDSIEDVTMIGCPRGIFDEANNLPIARRGSTASALPKRYNNKSEFLVDLACFPGSSGSPVFILDRHGYMDREKNMFMMGQQRALLLGVMYAGPTINANGEVVLSKRPSVTVTTMMHLGFVLRSTEILVIEDLVRERINNEVAMGEKRS